MNIISFSKGVCVILEKRFREKLISIFVNNVVVKVKGNWFISCLNVFVIFNNNKMLLDIMYVFIILFYGIFGIKVMSKVEFGVFYVKSKGMW